jgi:RNA polymerase sigma factor (sigma-70 family)
MGEESNENFDALYRANYARVHRLARRLVGADNADDVAQEVMIRALRHIHLLDPTRPVWPWLSAVTQNAAMDHYRRARGDLPANAADIERLTAPCDDVAAQVLRSDARLRLSRALGRMPAFDRLLLTRHEMEGVPVAAIARSLGQSPNALRQRLFRARRVLARHYRQLGGQYFWATPNVTARLANRRSRGPVRPSVRAAASLAVGSLLAGPVAVAPTGLPPTDPQARRQPGATQSRYGRETSLRRAAATGARGTLLALPADAVGTAAGLTGPAMRTVSRIVFGFDGAAEGWGFMPTAEPDCTGPTQAGPCALALDSSHARVTVGCASRRKTLALGARSRLSFYYLGDPGRVGVSFEVALNTGSFRLFLPDPATNTGIVLSSSTGNVTLPPAAGAGPGWHLVTLDIDPAQALLTLTVGGASKAVALGQNVGSIQSMTLVGDPFAERTGPSSTPSAARIDTMVVEQILPSPPTARKPAVVEVMSCPVAAAGGRFRGGPLVG